LEVAASRGHVLVLQVELRQQPARAVVVAVLGEEGEGASEVGARRLWLAVLDERLSGGELKQEIAGCGVGGQDQLIPVAAARFRLLWVFGDSDGGEGAREALARVGREAGVELLQARAEHAREQLPRAAPFPISLEQPAQGLEAVVALDQLDDERGLVVGAGHLLGALRPDEAVVEARDREQRLALEGGDEVEVDVVAPARPRATLLVDR